MERAFTIMDKKLDGVIKPLIDFSIPEHGAFQFDGGRRIR
jgi:hypothetical protein